MSRTEVDVLRTPLMGDDVVGEKPKTQIEDRFKRIGGREEEDHDHAGVTGKNRELAVATFALG